jgi:hypothetical protein
MKYSRPVLMRQTKQKVAPFQLTICAAAPAKAVDKHSRNTCREGESAVQEWAHRSGITSPKLTIADFAGERHTSGIKHA